MQANSPSIKKSSHYSSFYPADPQERVLFETFHTLLRKRSRSSNVIIISLGIVLTSLELYEHLMMTQRTTLFFGFEVLLVVALLGISSSLINQLITALREFGQANHLLQLKHEIAVYLTGTEDLNEVKRRLLQKAGQVAPGAKIELLLPDAQETYFRSANARTPEEIRFNPCLHCVVTNNGKAKSLSLCRQSFCFSELEKMSGLCLPLAQGNRPVGLLHVYLRDPQQPVDLQVRTLENVSMEMSSALRLALSYQISEKIQIDQKIQDVQMNLARDLHDTIGQDISYLRMRLNYLADQSDQINPALAFEIHQMFDVACESYDLIRGTLSLLQAGGPAELPQFFTRYAQQVAGRAGFEVTVEHQGRPRPLQPAAMRQWFFIFREALSNIEKHACAGQVQVIMTWTDSGLLLSISDDGRGFNPQQMVSGHYGLQFMQDRANSLHGNLSIQSEIGAGSTIQVQMPYE